MVDDAHEGSSIHSTSEQPPSTATNVGLYAKGSTTRLMWAALGVMGLSILAVFLCAFLGGPREFFAIGGWTILGSPFVALLALIARTFRFPFGKTLQASGRGIVVRRRLWADKEIAREEFVEGWLSPETREVYLVRRNGNSISADVEDAKSATSLLEHLGLDASKRTMRIRLGAVDFLNAMAWLVGPPMALTLGEFVGSAVNHAGALTIPLAIVLFVVQFFLVRRLLGPAHLVIGADGIIVEQRFGSRFVPFADLASISTDHDHVTLHLRGGAIVRARARHLDMAERRIIERRVNEALAVRAQERADPAALVALDRGTRTAGAWREALRGIFDKDRGYRAAQLSPEQIAAVLIDPAAPTARRIGAALALAQAGKTEHLPKIRIAAESSANQKVRVALQAIAEGNLDDEAIEEAAIEEANDVAKSSKLP